MYVELCERISRRKFVKIRIDKNISFVNKVKNEGINSIFSIEFATLHNGV